MLRHCGRDAKPIHGVCDDTEVVDAPTHTLRGNDGNVRSELGPMDLIADHISHRFGALDVLDKVSFTVRSGEVVAIVGPSGCGKSTLLSILGGLLRPSEGAGRTARRAAGEQPQPADLRVPGFCAAALVHGGSQCRISAGAYRARRQASAAP